MSRNPPARSVSLRHILLSRFLILMAWVVGSLRTLPPGSMPMYAACSTLLCLGLRLRLPLQFFTEAMQWLVGLP